MTIGRHRAVGLSSSPSSTAEGSSGRAGRRRCAALAVALAVTLMVSGAPAAAQPTIKMQNGINAPAGVLTRVFAVQVFDDAGTNPRFTDVDFFTLRYYSEIGISDSGEVWVRVKTDAELSALAVLPHNPFTINATVTMTNDEGQTASGTVMFETMYERVSAPGSIAAPSAPPPTPGLQLSVSDAPPGTLVGGRAFEMFHNAGTNPRYTGATFSPTKEWYDPISGIQGHGALWVKAKTAAELNALPSPPPSPFTVDVTVTMVNDEGQTASGTWTYRTTYDREEGPVPETSAPPAKHLPTPTGLEVPAPPGKLVIVQPASAFDHAGTHPRFTAAVFSATEYYEPHAGICGDFLWVKAKTAAELNALPSPPPSPFTVDVTVTMVNDEGQTASGTWTYRTTYDREEGPVPETSAPPAKHLPTPTGLEVPAPPGKLVIVQPASAFDHAGTHPRFTAAVFSATEYYEPHAGICGGFLWVKAKTAAELNALPSPPPSPFTVTARVTMTNDEGEATTGTVKLVTAYD